MELPVEDRPLAQPLAGRDAPAGAGVGPAGAGGENPVAGPFLDQEQAQEIVAEGIVMKAVDDAAADLFDCVGGDDFGAEAQQGGLPPDRRLRFPVGGVAGGFASVQNYSPAPGEGSTS